MGITIFPLVCRSNTFSDVFNRMAELWGRFMTVPSMRHSICTGFFFLLRSIPKSCQSSLSMKSICFSSVGIGSNSNEISTSPVESVYRKAFSGNTTYSQVETGCLGSTYDTFERQIVCRTVECNFWSLYDFCVAACCCEQERQ